MADITRQRNGEIIQALFSVLAANPDGIKPHDAIDETANRLVLTDFERGEYESSPGAKRFDKILRFATIGPVKAGWMTKSRADGWTITDQGLAALHQFTDPAAMTRESDRLYRAWKAGQLEPEPDAEEVEESTAALTLEEAQEAAWTEISKYLLAMAPYDFQDLVAALLEAMGYHIGWVAPPGPDRGIDIVAFTDPIGVEGPRIKVQVKRHADQKMNVADIRAFIAVLGDKDAGIYVSSGGFTKDAYQEARMLETRRLTLIDLEKLVELWTENYDSLADADRARLRLEPVYYLAESG